MTEIYSKNHAVSYKLHVIKQTVNPINCNDYMLRLNVLYVVLRLASSEVFWGVSIISSQVFGHHLHKGWIQTEACVIPSCLGMQVCGKNLWSECKKQIKAAYDSVKRVGIYSRNSAYNFQTDRNSSALLHQGLVCSISRFWQTSRPTPHRDWPWRFSPLICGKFSSAPLSITRRTCGGEQTHAVGEGKLKADWLMSCDGHVFGQCGSEGQQWRSGTSVKEMNVWPSQNPSFTFHSRSFYSSLFCTWISQSSFDLQ